MAGERDQLENELTGENKGIFTLTQADLETIGNLERTRQGYSLSLDEIDADTRVEKLKSLLNDMGEYMEATGFRNYLKDKFVDEYNFYDVESMLDATEGDADLIRAGCRIAFPIWKEAIQQLGVGLPTFRLKGGTHKKMINSLYSLVSNRVSTERMIEDYQQVAGINHKSNLNKLCYTVSRMQEYDIDFNGIIAGRARIGKSNLAANMTELIYGFRGNDIYRPMPDGRPWFKHYIDSRLIFEPGQGSAALKSSDGDVNWFDESYWTLDRRRSMSKKNIDLTRDYNVYASKKGVNLNLIQNFSDMDLRGTSKAVMVIILIDRGYGLLFSDARWIPLVRDQFGFEQLMENPDTMKDRNVAIHMLKSRREYVSEITWQERGAWEDNGVIMGADADPFYAYYLSRKLAFQNRPDVKEATKEVSLERQVSASKVKMIMERFKRGVRQIDIARSLAVTPAYVSQVVRGVV